MDKAGKKGYETKSGKCTREGQGRVGCGKGTFDETKWKTGVNKFGQERI